jgi:hypothetical protein
VENIVSFERGLPLMTLSEAVENVLELQKSWSARKTPDMEKRAVLIEHTVPELLSEAAKTYGFNRPRRCRGRLQ